VPYCQNYTPTDSFFGNFANWVMVKRNHQIREPLNNYIFTLLIRLSVTWY